MSIVDYIKDKMLFFIINFILYLVVAMTMVIVGANYIYVIFIFIIWFGPIVIYLIIELIKNKLFYDNIVSIMDNLDREHLLPEVMREPSFIEGKCVYEIVKRLGRDMHENIKTYEIRENDYREYMETWVHEIKTPIASSKLIIENNKNKATNKINSQINKIEGYVEQVLYYSRSNNVYKDYIIKEIKLKPVILKVIKKNSRDFISRNISISMDDKDLDKSVFSDSKWLEFILNQIMVNAIKYSKECGGCLKISVIQCKNSIILTIKDNGIGMEEIDVPRVFDKGFTGNNGRKYGRYGTSTGIGLYLCKKLCKKLGLGITLESEINKWTKVSIVFPMGTVLWGRFPMGTVHYN